MNRVSRCVTPCQGYPRRLAASQCLAAIVLGLVLAACPAVAAFAQEPAPAAARDETYYLGLQKTIAETLAAEKQNLELIKERIETEKAGEKEFANEISTHKLRLSSFRNLLLNQGTPPQELETAQAGILELLSRLSARREKVKQRLEELHQQRSRADEQYELNQKQLTEIKETDPFSPQIRQVKSGLKELLGVITAKRSLLSTLEGIYQKRLEQLGEIKDTLKDLARRYEDRIAAKRKEALFQRHSSPLLSLAWDKVQSELGRLGRQFGQLASPDFWGAHWKSLQSADAVFWLASACLFLILLALLRKFRRFCRSLERQAFDQRLSWRAMVLKLLCRSAILLGVTLFGYTYFQIQLLSSNPVVRTVFHVLGVLLFTRWALDFLRVLLRERPAALPAPLSWRLRLLIRGVRYFAVGYIISSQFLPPQSILLFTGRLVLEVLLISWTVSFWKHGRDPLTGFFASRAPKWSPVRPLLIGATYVIAGLPLILELSGYGPLALYWYQSWGITFTALLWGGLFLLTLREWDGKYREKAEAQAKPAIAPARSFNWLFVQLAWLAWFALLSLALMLAWGSKEAVHDNFFRLLTYSVSLGEIRLSLMGVITTVLILLFTHLATRLWRHFLISRILNHRGIETGLKDSITTISVYLIWAVGILVALHALGLSTTSLMVAFGALGIGLGFGLQNIFNNFVSGIILLFERPIQVGDAVEINGTWGTVTKINVRSTLIQTYDNASLIIPNSDLISNQVTNWSFKDLRLRRTITVGVAYGSDIERVREILLAIAAAHPHVLKYPRPDVLFSDFGDSALIFKLRIWSDVEMFLKVETDLRFEIDRQFREQGVQIPFPQRDLHIRSGPVQPSAAPPAARAPESRQATEPPEN